jgi:hypothetical protein
LHTIEREPDEERKKGARFMYCTEEEEEGLHKKSCVFVTVDKYCMYLVYSKGSIVLL